jgi:hypothetical protein
MPAKKIPHTNIEPTTVKLEKPVVVAKEVAIAIPATVSMPLVSGEGRLACRHDHFPTPVLKFAHENGITPLKWRSESAGYVLFSIRLQKYHIPI